jgi:hypothetical protein
MTAPPPKKKDQRSFKAFFFYLREPREEKLLFSLKLLQTKPG